MVNSKKYLEHSLLITNNSIKDYLYDFQSYLNSYANLIEFEVKSILCLLKEMAFGNRLNILI